MAGRGALAVVCRPLPVVASVVVHGLGFLWDLPRPGTEPVSPALAGGFLSTVPPGKSPGCFFCISSFTYMCGSVPWPYCLICNMYQLYK